MALLTDGNPNDDEALRAYETAILDVASVEAIDLDAKLSLATEEVSDDILDILLDHTRIVDPQSTIRRVMGVTDVVVTPQLKRWHALHTLEIVYRDAFNNQLNDRYQAKVIEYRDLSRNAREHAIRFGIGLALNPIPQAPQPVLSFVSGPIPETTYYVEVTWVSAMGKEGAPSDIMAFDTPAGSLLVAQALNPPTVAAGFNVYAGLTPTTLTLQSPTPIPTGQSFTLPDSGLVTGTPPGNGQTADIYIIGGPILRRG